MKIFTDEFICFVKKNAVCRWIGHKKGDWIEHLGFMAHGPVYKARDCEVCGEELEKRASRLFPSKAKSKNQVLVPRK